MTKTLDETIKEFANEIAKTIESSTAPARALSEAINKMAEEHRRIVDSLSKPILDVTNFANAMQKPISDAQKIIAKAVGGIKELQEFHKRFIQAQKEEKEALINTGWMICPSLMDIPTVYLRKAVVSYNNGDKGKAIANLMKLYYGESSWTKLNNTVKSWENHKLFTKQRMKIIRDALRAHKRKEYTLSIPALLPIVEGIVTDYCRIKKIRVPESKTTQKAKKALEELGLQGDGYISEILLAFILNQLYIPTNKLKASSNRKQLNRHGILHGSYAGYPDGTRSLKCFLILDVLTLLKV
jgi:hypothetical protein